MNKVISVLEYLNDPAVHKNFAGTSNDFREELRRMYGEWKSLSPNNNSAKSEDDAIKGYDEIVKKKIDVIKARASKFVSRWSKEIRKSINDRGLEDESWAKQTKEATEALESHVKQIKMEKSGFDGLT